MLFVVGLNTVFAQTSLDANSNTDYVMNDRPPVDPALKSKVEDFSIPPRIIDPTSQNVGAKNNVKKVNETVAQPIPVSEPENKAVTAIEISGVGVNTKIFDDPTAQAYMDKINAFIRSLTPSQIRLISLDDFGKIPPSGLALLSISQISAITPQQIQSLSGDQAIELSSGQIKVLYLTLSEKDFNIIYSQLSKKQLRDFIVQLSPKEISDLSIYQLSKLDLDVFSNLSSQQFNAFSDSQMAAFTTSQVNSLTDNQLYWSYSKLKNTMQRTNFIRILNKERLVAIIKFLPKSAYAQVLNSANPRVLVGLINAVNDSEKQLIVSRLNGLMISQIYSDLPETLAANLTPDQRAFLTEEQSPKVVED